MKRFLRKAFTELLERYGRKKIDMKDLPYKWIRIEIVEPESLKRTREGKDYDNNLEEIYERDHGEDEAGLLKKTMLRGDHRNRSIYKCGHL